MTSPVYGIHLFPSGSPQTIGNQTSSIISASPGGAIHQLKKAQEFEEKHLTAYPLYQNALGPLALQDQKYYFPFSLSALPSSIDAPTVIQSVAVSLSTLAGEQKTPMKQNESKNDGRNRAEEKEGKDELIQQITQTLFIQHSPSIILLQQNNQADKEQQERLMKQQQQSIQTDKNDIIQMNQTLTEITKEQKERMTEFEKEEFPSIPSMESISLPTLPSPPTSKLDYSRLEQHAQIAQSASIISPHRPAKPLFLPDPTLPSNEMSFAPLPLSELESTIPVIPDLPDYHEIECPPLPEIPNIPEPPPEEPPHQDIDPIMQQLPNEYDSRQQQIGIRPEGVAETHPSQQVQFQQQYQQQQQQEQQQPHPAMNQPPPVYTPSHQPLTQAPQLYQPNPIQGQAQVQGQGQEDVSRYPNSVPPSSTQSGAMPPPPPRPVRPSRPGSIGSTPSDPVAIQTNSQTQNNYPNPAPVIDSSQSEYGGVIPNMDETPMEEILANR